MPPEWEECVALITQASVQEHGSPTRLATEAQAQDLLRRAPSLAKAADKGGVTLLMLAADKGCAEISRELLQLGAEPGTHDYKWGNTSLHFAASSNSVQVLRALATHMAAANKHGGTPAAAMATANKHGDTPAMFAATSGSVEAFSFLVQGAYEDGGGTEGGGGRGGDAEGAGGRRDPATLELTNKSGDTLLLLAAQHAEEDMVRQLLGLGANCRHLNKVGVDAESSGAAMVKFYTAELEKAEARESGGGDGGGAGGGGGAAAAPDAHAARLKLEKANRSLELIRTHIATADERAERAAAELMLESDVAGAESGASGNDGGGGGGGSGKKKKAHRGQRGGKRGHRKAARETALAARGGDGGDNTVGKGSNDAVDVEGVSSRGGAAQSPGDAAAMGANAAEGGAGGDGGSGGAINPTSNTGKNGIKGGVKHTMSYKLAAAVVPPPGIARFPFEIGCQNSYAIPNSES